MLKKNLVLFGCSSFLATNHTLFCANYSESLKNMATTVQSFPLKQHLNRSVSFLTNSPNYFFFVAAFIFKDFINLGLKYKGKRNSTSSLIRDLTQLALKYGISLVLMEYIYAIFVKNMGVQYEAGPWENRFITYHRVIIRIATILMSFVLGWSVERSFDKIVSIGIPILSNRFFKPRTP